MCARNTRVENFKQKWFAMNHHRCVFKNLQLVFSGSMYALIARIAQNSPVLPQGTAKIVHLLLIPTWCFLQLAKTKRVEDFVQWGKTCASRRETINFSERTAQRHVATAKVSLVFLIKKKSLMGCLLLMFSIPLPSREKRPYG